MTRHEIATLKNAATNNTFGADFAGNYDISNDEADRIADRANSLAEFEAIWENETWWRDESNA
ncbi:hypothetical protein ACEYYA_01015 [Paracoccus sp. p3-h83]|uniref:hypothetical protein n=1 Tax=Paracoccus sp. p3-h83 TaxID=3342805 RepID=UPI0035B9830C